MLLNPKRRCPRCHAVVPNRRPVGRTYRCPGCASELQTSWIMTGLLLIIPIGFLSVPLMARLWPTKLEPWDGGRVI